ncbi:glycosyltransferase family 2 protein [Desulfothermobacter acidiphilus]|uniref:glycosyltransferase family 2 protein n=1 Tax=Desulfothermobacter acidiphilus TaxID=1938353 RepID=UPI003F8AF817
MISVVCVYNDKKVLGEWLMASLKNQKGAYELILVDNSAASFGSAAEALNHGGEQAKGDYIMFVHQDVRLERETWLEEAEAWLRRLPSLGVAGVAGVSARVGADPREMQWNLIKHGVPPKSWGNVITCPELVQTVDELLIIVPRKVFNFLKFDPQTCPGWHLYGVDYCLRALKKGLLVYVLPLPVWHRSTGGGPETPLGILLNLGVAPKSYYRDLRKLLTKHRRDYRLIYTTCGVWNTYWPLTLQRLAKILSMGWRYTRRRLIKEFIGGNAQAPLKMKD